MSSIPFDAGGFLFRRIDPDHTPADELKVIGTSAPEIPEIRCPQCGWRPLKSSRWICVDAGAPEYFSGGCGSVWHTFETGGVCPGCSHQWIWTSCLACGRWSLHDDWYSKRA